MRSFASLRVLASTVLLLPQIAFAHEAGEWLGRFGVHHVEPKSSNHDTVSVESTQGITGSIEYFLSKQMAVDLLVGVPFKHDITLNSGGTVASTQHLPPTLSLAWYPSLPGSWRPYLGVGVNYTIFFGEDTQGPLAGSDLKLDPSLGLAALVGAEWDISQDWSLALDMRYMDIDTDASLDGNGIGTVEIDPIAAGISLGYRFR